MGLEDEIKEKLKTARAEVKRLEANLGLYRAFNKGKFDLKPIQEYLTEEDRERVTDKAKDWLTEEHVQSVLSACATYRWHCRDEHPQEQQKRQKQKGRPEGGDWCVKALINELAGIWYNAEGKLPCQYQSKFGEFVDDIAVALNAVPVHRQETAWPGIINEVLKGKNHARYREACRRPHYFYSVRPESSRETFAAAKDEDWLNKLEEKETSTCKVVGEAIENVLEKLRVEEEIKKILETVKNREAVLKLLELDGLKLRKISTIEPDNKSG